MVSPEGPTDRSPRSSGSSCRWILVVDDDAAFREMMADVLGSVGYPVQTAGSADEARSRVAGSAEGPALLVTDVVMPGTGGVELARELSTDDPSLGVLFISGHSEDVIDGHALPPAKVRFLRKPFGLEDAIDALEALGRSAPRARDRFLAASPSDAGAG